MPPCSDSRSYTDEQRDRLRDEHQRLTVLLCAASNILKRYGYNFQENPELDEWVTKHLRVDKSRARE